jgi:hypothetical protein
MRATMKNCFFLALASIIGEADEIAAGAREGATTQDISGKRWHMRQIGYTRPAKRRLKKIKNKRLKAAFKAAIDEISEYPHA